MHYPAQFILGDFTYRLEYKELIVEQEKVAKSTSINLENEANQVSDLELELLSYEFDLEEQFKNFFISEDRTISPGTFPILVRKPDEAYSCVLLNHNARSTKISSLETSFYFSKYDIYSIDLFYGKGKCNRYVTEGKKFVQAHCKCPLCADIVLCLYCAFAHHPQEHLKKEYFKYFKDNKNIDEHTDEELEEYNVQCECKECIV